MNIPALTIIGCLCAAGAAAQPTAEQITACLKNSGLAQTSGFKLKQEIRREGQAPRTFQAECYLADEAEKMLVSFEDPADMAGVKILLKERGKQMWTYFPRTNRVRKMAGSSSSKPIGSLGFSYDDLFPYLEGDDYKKTVDGTETVDGVSCNILKVDHTGEAAATYKTSKVAVDEQACLIRQSRFFAEDGRLLKTVSFTNYTLVEGRTIPTRITISQPDLGESSTVTILAVEFQKDYGPTFFSELSLKR